MPTAMITSSSKRFFYFTSFLLLVLAILATSVRVYSSVIFQHLREGVHGSSRDEWQLLSSIYMEWLRPALLCSCWLYPLVNVNALFVDRSSFIRYGLQSLLFILTLCAIIWAASPLTHGSVGLSNMMEIASACILTYLSAIIPCVVLARAKKLI